MEDLLRSTLLFPVAADPVVGEEGEVEVRGLRVRLEEREKRVRVLESQLKVQDSGTAML